MPKCGGTLTLTLWPRRLMSLSNLWGSHCSAFPGISWQCGEKIMDYVNIRQNDKCVLSSYYSDEKRIALVAIPMTELLSAPVAVTLSRGSQSNFQCLAVVQEPCVRWAGVLRSDNMHPFLQGFLLYLLQLGWQVCEMGRAFSLVVASFLVKSTEQMCFQILDWRHPRASTGFLKSLKNRRLDVFNFFEDVSPPTREASYALKPKCGESKVIKPLVGGSFPLVGVDDSLLIMCILTWAKMWRKTRVITTRGFGWNRRETLTHPIMWPTELKSGHPFEDASVHMLEQDGRRFERGVNLSTVNGHRWWEVGELPDTSTPTHSLLQVTSIGCMIGWGKVGNDPRLISHLGSHGDAHD